jgi:uncharacterized protein YfcZ (UPF0381/DUF406 family)
MTTTDQRSEAQIISPEKLESLAAQQRRCGYTLAGVCDALDDSAAELRRLAEENERLKAQVVPEGWKLVPVEPSAAHIESMAMRFDHSHGIAMSIPPETEDDFKRRQEYNRRVSRQMYEEAIGEGFFKLSAAPAHTNEQIIGTAAPTQEDACKVPQGWKMPDSYKAGTLVSNTDGGAAITLHFSNVNAAESMFAALTEAAAPTQVETQGWKVNINHGKYVPPAPPLVSTGPLTPTMEPK